MTTSTPSSISKSNRTEAEVRLGFFARRPWLFVVGAFCVLFAAWGTMFYLAYTNLPELVPLSHEESLVAPE
jgi:hypothetical protein